MTEPARDEESYMNHIWSLGTKRTTLVLALSFSYKASYSCHSDGELGLSSAQFNVGLRLF